MTDMAPRSWRSIIFRPGRPPMKKRTAVLLSLGVLLLNIGADVVLLTKASVLGRIADLQLRRRAGDLLAFERVTMTLGGRLRIEKAEVCLPDRTRPFLAAERVIATIGHREGSFVVESIVLEEPRVRLSDRLVADMGNRGGAGPGKPLRELIPPHLLPRVTCRGGTLELGHSSVLASEEPQIFEIRELVMVPTTGYRYFVRGTLRNALVGEWRVQGEIDLDSGQHEVHLSTDQLVLGTAIRQALNPSIHVAWDRFRPVGPAAADIYLAYDRRKPDEGEVFRLTLKPRGLTLLYENFAYLFEQVRGEIEFRLNGFTIKQIDARHGKSTAIRFDGRADGYGEDAGYDFRVEMDDVPLDDSLRNALGKNARDVWATFRPSGTLDARATIHRESGPNLKESIPVDLFFKEAAFVYSGFPYSIERAVGEVRVQGDEVIIKRLRGVHGRGDFRFSGRIDSISADPEVDLDVRATSLELDARFRDALPAETRAVWDRVLPTGEVDLDLRLLRSKGGEPRIRATARARGNRVLVRDVPLPVTIREGTVEFNEGRVRLNHLMGQVDPIGEIAVSGEISPGADGPTTHLEIDGKAIPIDDRFKERMPRALSDVLKSLKLSGTADFKFTMDEWRERDRPAMRVSLRLDLRKGVIATDVRVEDLDGTVILAGPIRDGKPTMSGKIDVRSARILKKQVQNFSTNFAILGSMLVFRDITADAYGGKVLGWFSLDSVTNDIEGDFTVSRLDLREFVNDTAKWSGKTIAGKVDLRIPKLTGKANDLVSLKSGEEGCLLSITEGQLLDVPGIVNFLDPLGSGGRFTAMKAFFDIRDGKFKIKEFAFLDKIGSGSVIGQGDFFFDGKFKVKVWTETAALFGLDFVLARIPGVLFDLFKKPFKKTFEGDLESSKIIAD